MAPATRGNQKAVVKNRLSHADYDQLLSSIEAIHRCRTLADYPKHVLTELRKLIDCNTCGYNEVNLVRNRLLVVFDPPRPDMDVMIKVFESLMHQHPVINYFNNTGDGQALKISDFLGAREFYRLPIYHQFYKFMAAKDQISFGVRVEHNFIIGIAFNRDERTFTERDRIVLNLMRPHIIQAYLYAEETAGHLEQKDDLQTALRQNGIGVIALHSTGKVIHTTPAAFECLTSYLPAPASEEPRLPEGLARWALGAADGPEADAPYVVPRDSSTLTIRRVRTENRLLLLLSEQDGLAKSPDLSRYQLTPRENEVLQWVAEGKSNSAIATILGLTAGTVKLHVERILAKLGVENRTSAALAARGSPM